MYSGGGMAVTNDLGKRAEVVANQRKRVYNKDCSPTWWMVFFCGIGNCSKCSGTPTKITS